jgi:hypothetical protein
MADPRALDNVQSNQATAVLFAQGGYLYGNKRKTSKPKSWFELSLHEGSDMSQEMSGPFLNIPVPIFLSQSRQGKWKQEDGGPSQSDMVPVGHI